MSEQRILELALREMSLALDALIAECTDAEGKPKAPNHQMLMRSRGLLPPYCAQALRRTPKKGTPVISTIKRFFGQQDKPVDKRPTNDMSIAAAAWALRENNEEAPMKIKKTFLRPLSDGDVSYIAASAADQLAGAIAKQTDDLIREAITRFLGRSDWSLDELRGRAVVAHLPKNLPSGVEVFCLDGVALLELYPATFEQRPDIIGGTILNATRQHRFLVPKGLEEK